MKPNKAETAVNVCHCPVDMAVRMRKALARPWVGVRLCHLGAEMTDLQENVVITFSNMPRP